MHVSYLLSERICSIKLFAWLGLVTAVSALTMAIFAAVDALSDEEACNCHHRLDLIKQPKLKLAGMTKIGV